MWRVRITMLGRGTHSSEMVVSVRTADGNEEEIVVDSRSIKDGALEIGFPVGIKGDNYLVELPRETMRGAWRIWVPKESTMEEVAA